MADPSQSFATQLQLVKKLRRDVSNRKQILLTFLTAYKKQIDQAYNDKMMMETIRELRNSGFPKYEAQVKRAVRQLDMLDEALQKAEKSLNTASQGSPKL